MSAALFTPAEARAQAIEALAECYLFAQQRAGLRAGDGDAYTQAAVFFDYAAGATHPLRQGWLGLLTRVAGTAP